jgi:hypothetical protein
VACVFFRAASWQAHRAYWHCSASRSTGALAHAADVAACAQLDCRDACSGACLRDASEFELELPLELLELRLLACQVLLQLVSLIRQDTDVLLEDSVLVATARKLIAQSV